jgi:hypothetical protein
MFLTILFYKKYFIEMFEIELYKDNLVFLLAKSIN